MIDNPKFKGRRIDNGELVEGWLVELCYEKYIILERTALPSEFLDKTIMGQPIYQVLFSSVEQIGGDLYSELSALKAQIEESEGRAIQLEETADHFKGRAEEIERELNEANEQIRAWENEALQSRATIALLVKSTEKLSVYEAQIESGELIPADIAREYLNEYWMLKAGSKTLKQFAAERVSGK